MKHLLKENKGIYYCLDEIPKISKNEIIDLISKIKKTSDDRSRVCMHKNVNERFHEMFIVLKKNCYIRPHKHLKKSESMSVIDGEADAIIFDDKGRVTQKIELGNYISGKEFYYRMSSNTYHMLLVKSETFVFHEATEGPFIKNDTIFPEWAPTTYKKSFIDSI